MTGCNRLTGTLALLGACASSTPALAVNRCTDAAGKVTFQDLACPAAPSLADTGKTGLPPRPPAAEAVSGRTSSANYSTASGVWRGAAQFQLVLEGQSDLGVQRVAPIVVELSSDGKVVGAIPEMGCKFSGLSTQFDTPAIAGIDVMLKGCADERFNLRLTGQLVSIRSAGRAQLSLNGPAQALGDKFQQVSVEASLRR